MLARGLLRRVAVTAPKTTTSDLPQLARLLQRLVLSRNASVLSAAPAVSRELSAAIADFRRSYATTTQATKPTKTVKKAVKKTAATKATPKKKTSAKKAAPKKKKTKAKKKAAPKKKKAPRAKKVLSPEEQEKATIRELRRRALSPPLIAKRIEPIHILVKEVYASKKPSDIGEAQRDARAKLGALSPAELEHYNHLANQETAAKEKEYDAWVHSYTPEQIRSANYARAKLRKLSTVKSTMFKKRILDPRDEEQSKRPYMIFVKERWASGDMKGLSIPEASKLISREWKALSDAEKKKYAPA